MGGLLLPGLSHSITQSKQNIAMLSFICSVTLRVPWHAMQHATCMHAELVHGELFYLAELYTHADAK